MTSKSVGGFNSLTSKARLFFSFGLRAAYLCLILLFFTIAQGQEAGLLLIGNIEVKVDGQPAAPEMRQLIPLSKGEPFSFFLIRQVIERLYLTKLFSNIQVFSDGQNPVNLTFYFERQLYLRQVNFNVEGGLSAELLRSEVKSLREGEPFDEGLLEAGKSEIIDILKREGFFNPDLQVIPTKLPSGGLVDLDWKINPKERLKIQGLVWKGDGEKVSPKDKGRLVSLIKDNYSPRQLEAECLALQQALRRKGFSRAEVSYFATLDEAAQEVALEINVQLHEKVIIEFRGAKVPLSLVTPLWEERVFEEWALSEGEARVLRYLRRKGYFEAQIKSSLEKNEAELRVTYTLELGPKRRLRSVIFSGLNQFSEERLRQALGLNDRTPFAAVIDGERLYDLPKEIEAFYQMNGFPQVRVWLELDKKENEVIARLNVDEGNRETIGEISFNPHLSFSAEQLRGLISSQPGGPYYSPQVKLDRQRLIEFYQRQGFRGTSVSVEEKVIQPNVYSLLFKIEEGRRYRLRRIFFSGTVTTKEATIRKELRIKEGDWADENLIQESKRNLERLGIFASVQVEEIPAWRDELDLVFRFHEGERNLASVGLGLETKSEPRGFEVWNNVLRLRGTAEIVRTNLLGDASQLSFVSQMSLKETRGVVSWEQPYFFGVPFRGYMNIWLEREERVSFGFDRRGVSLTGIKALSGDLMTVMTFRYARTVLTHLEITESEVDRQFFPFSSTSFSSSLIRDRRDDSFNPQKGYFASAVLEWAFPLFRAEAEFLKAFIKYQRFFSLAPRWNLATTFRLGLGRGRIPIHERFFAGGSNSFRGEEFDALGPKDAFSGKPVGGKALILFNFEFSLPLLASLPNLSATIFYDSGNVFSKRSQFNLASMHNALGFGLRYRTPLGPLRLELGWNLSELERKAKPLLFLTIGQVF